MTSYVELKRSGASREAVQARRKSHRAPLKKEVAGASDYTLRRLSELRERVVAEVGAEDSLVQKLSDLEQSRRRKRRAPLEKRVHEGCDSVDRMKELAKACEEELDSNDSLILKVHEALKEMNSDVDAVRREAEMALDTEDLTQVDQAFRRSKKINSLKTLRDKLKDKAIILRDAARTGFRAELRRLEQKGAKTKRMMKLKNEASLMLGTDDVVVSEIAAAAAGGDDSSSAASSSKHRKLKSRRSSSSWSKKSSSKSSSNLSNAHKAAAFVVCLMYVFLTLYALSLVLGIAPDDEDGSGALPTSLRGGIASGDGPPPTDTEQPTEVEAS